MQLIPTQKAVDEFQQVAKNPAEQLYFNKMVLIQKKLGEPKVQRQLYLSGVGMYICHKAMITRKLPYRMVQSVIVAQFSGECLLIIQDPTDICPDLIIDSFQYREAIVNIIMRFNKTTNLIYKQETTLRKYIRKFDNGQLKSTPYQQPSGMAAFKKLLESHLKERQHNPGKELSDYLLCQLISTTKKGKTYFAKKKSTKLPVVLRTIKKRALEADRMLLQTLKTERTVHQQLDSRFVCKLLKCFATEKRLFWIFQYVSGYTLQKLMDKMKTFPQQHLQLYFGQLIIAVGHIHQSGYTFNNLNPQHVMLDEKGHIKLIGLDKCVQVDSEGTYNSKDFDLQYMCPERLLPNGELGPPTAASDWWSLGVLFYKMTQIGGMPFNGNSQQDLKKCIKTGDVGFDEGSCSRPCEDLIRQLLVKNPSERLGTSNSYHQVIAHKFFQGYSRANLQSQSHSTFFSSRGLSKQDFKELLQLSADGDGPDQRLQQELEMFDYN